MGVLRFELHELMCPGTISSTYSTSGTCSFCGSSEIWTPRTHILRNDQQRLLYQWNPFVRGGYEIWQIIVKSYFRTIVLLFFLWKTNCLFLKEGKGRLKRELICLVFFSFCVCAKIRDREMANHNVVGYKVKNKAKFHCRYSSKIQQKTHWKRQSRYIIVVGFLCVLLGCTRANMIVNLLL